ncbi:phosphoglycolate phosphatase [Halobacteriales archaeon QS_1_68_17]|nr:MAG: phosphoglycolate phosphatase [Halobacteriales archaeon QS_1_68_17]
MTESDYEAYVYDLDGTLVDLDVNWGAAARAVAAALRERGIDVGEADLWTMLELGDETGTRDVVESALAEHEREGARTSRRLPAADTLPQPVAVGVCSLNCESAARIALEIHGLDGYVDAVVGRDSHELYKPAPEPLLETVSRLDADPGRTLFVGDSERDERTARRAGTAFAYVSAFLD